MFETTMSRQAAGERLEPSAAVVPLRAHPALQGATRRFTVQRCATVVAGTRLGSRISRNLPSGCVKSMKNHHADGKTQYKWPFSIAMLKHQRVP